MDHANINRILELNNEFYKNHAKDFSVSRQYPWKGWERVVEFLNEKFFGESVRILDVGCGNGRFFGYLSSRELSFDFEYLGVDNNEFLLNEAEVNYSKKGFENCRFDVVDVFNDLSRIGEKFDVIVVFGVAHHIPDKELRKKWFKELDQLNTSGGVKVVTFWNFIETKQFGRVSQKQDQIAEQLDLELEKNDYLLGWGSDDNFRFCHFYDKDELALLVGESVIHLKFDSDGTGTTNLYVIYS